MGSPHARWILCCVVAVACCLTWYTTTNFQRDKREVTHPHDYSKNLWWQLMNKTAYEGNETNCYVCAHMAYATHNSGLKPGNIIIEQQKCLYGLSTQPSYNITSNQTIEWKQRNYSTPLQVVTETQKLITNLNGRPPASASNDDTTTRTYHSGRSRTWISWTLCV